MSVNNESENKPTPRPWKNESFHHTFDQADAIRQKLKRIWDSSETHQGMEVKVKFLPSRSQYVVKTRKPVDLSKKEQNKNGKSKRRNKKNTSGGKFDPSATV